MPVQSVTANILDAEQLYTSQQMLSPALVLNEKSVQLLISNAQLSDLSLPKQVSNIPLNQTEKNSESASFSWLNFVSMQNGFFMTALTAVQFWSNTVFQTVREFLKKAIITIVVYVVILQVVAPIGPLWAAGIFMPGNNIVVSFEPSTQQVSIMTRSGKPLMRYHILPDGSKEYDSRFTVPGYTEKDIFEALIPPSESGVTLIDLRSKTSNVQKNSGRIIADKNLAQSIQVKSMELEIDTLLDVQEVQSLSNDTGKMKAKTLSTKAAADPLRDFYRVKYKKDVHPAVAAAMFNSQGFLAEPNQIYHSDMIGNSQELDPFTNPYYSDQWGLQVMRVPEAWDILSIYDSTRFPPTAIGVLDTGVASNLDLDTKLINPETSLEELHTHGTWVASTAAALHNDFGIIGPAYYPQVSVINEMALRGGMATSEDIAKGIINLTNRAVAEGMQNRFIINASFGSLGPASNLITAAWDVAFAKMNVFVSAAAGNDYTNLDKYEMLWEAPRFHRVAASGISNSGEENKAYFTNYGRNIPYAPGVDIIVTGPDGNAEFVNGTSFSAPLQSGIAELIILNQAMVHGMESLPFNHEEIASILWNTSDIKNFNGTLVHRLNAENALSVNWPGVSLLENENVVFPYRGQVEIKGTARTYGGEEKFDSYVLDIKTIKDAEWIPINSGTAPVISGVLGAFDQSQIEEGFYTLRLRVNNIYGQVFETTSRIGVGYSVLEGWPQQLPGRAKQSTYAELNGLPGKELLVSTLDGFIAAKTSDGTSVSGWDNIKYPEETLGKTLPVDIDNDGIDEVIITNSVNMITVYDANANVLSATDIRGQNLRYDVEIQEIVITDFDGDGQPDLAVSSSYKDEYNKTINIVQTFDIQIDRLRERSHHEFQIGTDYSHLWLFATQAGTNAAGNNTKNIGVAISSVDGEQFNSMLAIIDPTTGEEIVSHQHPNKMIYRPPVSEDIDGDGQSEIFFTALNSVSRYKWEPQVLGLSSDLSKSLDNFPVTLDIKTPPFAIETSLAIGMAGSKENRDYRIVFGVEDVSGPDKLFIVSVNNPNDMIEIVLENEPVTPPLIVTVKEDNKQARERTLAVFAAEEVVLGYDMQTGDMVMQKPYNEFPGQAMTAADFTGNSRLELSVGSGFQPADDPSFKMFLLSSNAVFAQWPQEQGQGNTGLPEELTQEDPADEYPSKEDPNVEKPPQNNKVLSNMPIAENAPKFRRGGRASKMRPDKYPYIEGQNTSKEKTEETLDRKAVKRVERNKAQEWFEADNVEGSNKLSYEIYPNSTPDVDKARVDKSKFSTPNMKISRIAPAPTDKSFLAKESFETAAASTAWWEFAAGIFAVFGIMAVLAVNILVRLLMPFLRQKGKKANIPDLQIIEKQESPKTLFGQALTSGMQSNKKQSVALPPLNKRKKLSNQFPGLNIKPYPEHVASFMLEASI